MITMEQKHMLDLRDAARAAREEGKAEGEQRCARLVAALLEADRLDDLKRMTKDKDCFERLCTEFGLSYDE